MTLKKVISILICITVLTSFKVCCASPDISAHSAILTDMESGRVLYSKNAEERLPIASTTKIMTALCVLEDDKINIDEPFEISQNAANTEGSSMYLKPMEIMTVRELLYGLMLQSGNDAAVALAERVSGSVEDFCRLMNEKAEKLGLSNTHFTNPNGLPDSDHYSSALDMSKLCRAALSNEMFSAIVKTKTFKISGDNKAYPRVLNNHNKLLSAYEGCTGIKTGFTKTAGRCLASSAQRNGATLICITLNDPDDWEDHKKLFDFGFNSFKWEKISDSTASICSAQIKNGEKTYDLYPQSDVYYPFADGESFVFNTSVFENLAAPLKSGNILGYAEYFCNDKSICSVPLVLKENAEKKSVSSLFYDNLGIALEKFFKTWTYLSF